MSVLSWLGTGRTPAVVYHCPLCRLELFMFLMLLQHCCGSSTCCSSSSNTRLPSVLALGSRRLLSDAFDRLLSASACWQRDGTYWAVSSCQDLADLQVMFWHVQLLAAGTLHASVCMSALCRCNLTLVVVRV
jgi:hypothetical protein